MVVVVFVVVSRKYGPSFARVPWLWFVACEIVITALSLDYSCFRPVTCRLENSLS